MIPRFCVSVTCLGFVLVAGAARAQDPVEAGQASGTVSEAPDERAIKEAGDRYSRGLQLYSEGDYALAVIEFERAYSLVPDYRVLYNIGQVRLQLANYAKARRALEQYLKEGGERVPEERRKAVRGDLDMLVARTATVRIETNVAGADVVVDDVSVGQAPLSEPLLLDAGEHRIVVQHSGYQPRATQLTLAGLDEKSLRVDLEVVPEGKASQIIVQKAPESNRSTWLWATWSATGAFAIGAGVLGGLGAKAASDLDDLRGDENATRGELDSSSRRARTLLTVGDVLGGLAIASGGVALYLTLSAPRSEPGTESPKVAERSVGVVARPNFVGLGGHF